MESRLTKVKSQIDALLGEKEFVIVAIDGKCTSGKTTLAAKLAEIYDCNVFHMDDFFLRPEQRTAERFLTMSQKKIFNLDWIGYKS